LLVFTTPWNTKGNEYALKYANKINIFSPVWFDLKVKQVSQKFYDIEIEGHHNVDKEYLAKLKANNPNIQIYPRLHIPGNLYESLYYVFSSQETLEIVDKIVAAFKDYKEFDGMVLDSPLIPHIGSLQFDLLELIELLSTQLGANEKNLIISVLALHDRQEIKPNVLAKLILVSYKVLICTYDYNSDKDDRNPISPYKWLLMHIDYVLEQTELNIKQVQRKVMMGLPFYGYQIDYKTSRGFPIVYNEYLKLLNTPPLQMTWDNEIKECVIHADNRQSLAMFPCLKFLDERLKLLEEYGLGAFIWEGGQGLEYFYEMF